MKEKCECEKKGLYILLYDDKSSSITNTKTSVINQFYCNLTTTTLG